MANVCVSCPSTPRRRRASARRAPARRRRRAPVRRRAASSRRRQTARRTARQRGLTKFELAQVNPFDRRVIGVKIPDSNTQPSDTFYSEDRFSITTGATDYAQTRAFLPNLSVAMVVANNFSSSSWTWPPAYAGTSSAVYTDAQSNFVGVRPCGHGVKISCPSAPTSVTGFVHVAMYPLELPTRVIKMHSDVVGIILDPFLGSGTTMVACQNLNRKCRGIEISPAYCAVILQRMTDAFPGIEIRRIDK